MSFRSSSGKNPRFTHTYIDEDAMLWAKSCSAFTKRMSGVPGLLQVHLSIFYWFLFFATLSGTSKFSHPKKRAIWLIKCQRLRPGRKSRLTCNSLAGCPQVNHIFVEQQILPAKTQVESDETQDETAT